MNQPPTSQVNPTLDPQSTPTPKPGTANEETRTSVTKVDRFESPESDAFRASKQASEWNSLLKWDRTTRLLRGGGIDGGWDYATGMYHVPRQSAEYYSNVERDPNAPTTTSGGTASSRHPTSVTISANGDREFELSGDETTGVGAGAGGTSKGYHVSGRPKRSRQAMTRG